MDIHEAIIKRRSIRKFCQKPVSLNILKELVKAASLAPSAANLQPLKYMIIIDANFREMVFDSLKWAAYIFPEGNPGKEEKPVAYIIVVVDETIEKYPAERDVGCAVENMLLLACSKNIGTCWLGAFDKEKLSTALDLPTCYRVDSVIALGYPKEESCIEKWQADVKYFKDESGKMHVPKRNIEDIIIKIE
jgi:nitroreductase